MGKPRLESRNSSSAHDDTVDERELPELLPELREGSEPLDLLKWELTALKLGRDLDDAITEPKTPWEAVKNVRDAVAAEIEIRKKHKPGRTKAMDDRPLGFKTEEKLETIGIQAKAAGTVDNPIMASKSLDSTGRKGKKTPEKSEKNSSKVASATALKKKPPLPPRPKPPLAPPKQSGASPPCKQTQQPQEAQQGTLAPRGATLSPGTATEAEQKTAPIKNGGKHNYFQPIVIDTVDRGNYDDPILLLSGSIVSSPSFKEPLFTNSADSAFKQVRSNDIFTIDSMVERDRRFNGDKIVSPCQNSSIIKCAYSLISEEDGPKWPDELQVVSTVPSVAVPTVNEMPAVNGIPTIAEHYDLSHMDADDLEAEYARLVKARGVESEANLTGSESVEYRAAVAAAALSATLSDNSGSQEESENASIDMPVAASATKESETQEEEDTSVAGRKSKPLEELRKRSMVTEVSSGDQDGKSTEGNVDESQQLFIPVKPSTDEHDNRPTLDGPKKNEEEDEERELTLTRDPSALEAPDPRQAESEDPMEDQMLSASSEGIDEESQGANTDDGSNTQDEANEERSIAMSVGEEHMPFLSAIDAGTKRKRDRIDCDFPSIGNVVAGYFSAGTSKITDEGARAGKADIKKTFFAEAGGCCLALH
ncbi:expressed unknown protein [Seminavis robusta]|uniref:Uncharacterized protein n=1 Tax=Seminavis robusta TaxID=568900 RepID=A0A9N8EYQ3_9STRA|nr:expressed unknown protein [Seminavis robusta]|eukprot:Sro2000_g310260.1 n/a (651) ;mRNA; f:16228-18180